MVPSCYITLSDRGIFAVIEDCSHLPSAAAKPLFSYLLKDLGLFILLRGLLYRDNTQTRFLESLHADITKYQRSEH